MYQRDVSYQEHYNNELKKELTKASPQALKVCRAWHHHFGEPGWGGIDFVAMEIHKAEVAVKALSPVV